MPVREGPPQPAPPRKDEDDRARAEGTALRKRLQWIVLITGLAGAVLIALLFQVRGTPAVELIGF